jgi:hypothetical protein
MMEQGFDKEVHSLLRRTRGRSHARDTLENGGGAEPRAHLDADELGAFAEGALPSAARVAAASHLADCDDCRGILVGLVRAAGVESELEKSAAAEAQPLPVAKTGTPFREWLDAIFAPRVLRFVAPLLAVCLVGAVAFVALRSSRSGNSQLAREMAPNTAAPAPVQITKPEEGLTADAAKSEPTGTTGGQAAAGEHKKEAAVALKDAATQPAAPVVAGSTDAPPPPEASREAGTQSAPATAGPAAAAGTAAAPPPPSVSARSVQELPARPQPKPADENESAKTKAGDSPKQVAEEVRIESGRNAQTQNRANQVNNVFDPPSPDGGSRGQKRAAAPRTLGEGEAPEADKDRSAARRNARSESRARRDEDKEEVRAEERTAAGHRFRREGGAWVDVNYRPSMSQTGVRRGTDAFRALVADVPQVGRAAEQLSGEFIIVVSGRAYRVRP